MCFLFETSAWLQHWSHCQSVSVWIDVSWRRGRLLVISVKMDNDFMTVDQNGIKRGSTMTSNVSPTPRCRLLLLEVKGESRGVNVITGGRGRGGGITRKRRGAESETSIQPPQGRPCHFSSSSPLRCRQPVLSVSLGCAPPVRRASSSGRGLREGGLLATGKGQPACPEAGFVQLSVSLTPTLPLPPRASLSTATQASGGPPGLKGPTTLSQLQEQRDSMAPRASVPVFL